MAIVQNPITGRTRKKFGTAVFSKQFGHNTMRTAPAGMKNPNTPAQAKQRLKFSTIVHLVRQVLPLINSVYGNTIITMSPFNKIVSINVKNAFNGDPPVLDHKKVVFCDIEGSSILEVEMTAQANHVMEITWDPNSNDADELSTMLTFILINCTTNKVLIYHELVARNAGSITVTAPSEWVGAMTALHVMTVDYSQVESGGDPQAIIKFKDGCDVESTVL